MIVNSILQFRSIILVVVKAPAVFNQVESPQVNLTGRLDAFVLITREACEIGPSMSKRMDACPHHGPSRAGELVTEA